MNASYHSDGRCMPGRGRRFSCLAVAAAVIFAVAGCATEPQVGAHTFLHEPRPAKPPGAPVDIFANGLPARPFTRVAILDAHCEQQFFAEPTLQQALPILQNQARAAGCDAVIEIQEAKAPENWTLETKVKHFTGVGIAYK
jgi:hypothetical protein